MRTGHLSLIFELVSMNIHWLFVLSFGILSCHVDATEKKKFILGFNNHVFFTAFLTQFY